ncbi:hypothetical protein ACJW31_12G113500 [Castanea mollissima]
MAAAATATAFPLALPNCTDRCGDVKIPYPFGTTKGCFLNETRDFLINCSNSSGQPQPLSGNVKVTNISIEGQIEILMFKAEDCYNYTNGTRWQKTTAKLKIPSFTISAIENKFVAVGCDTYAFLSGNLNGQQFSIGCLFQCQNISSVVNGSCSGIGCCQLDIPEGLKNVSLETYSFKNHTQVWDFNPCSFAFVIRKDKFHFSSDNLTSLQSNETFPRFLIGQLETRPNTTCIDLNPINGPGYRCECKEGYLGNPYLKDGCQHIDECKGINNCTGKQFCVNKPGNYECLCIKGYHLESAVSVSNQSSLAIHLAVGYGTVHRGVLSDKTVVAIKKSKIGVHSQIEQFINEMIILTQINHRNVVKLYGCCLETKVPLLVYDFITNGTLSTHVHDKGLSPLLSWEKHLKIPIETAGAPAYLHSSTSMPIIHRDVKTMNILLDDNYTAKVADFGALKLAPLDQTELNTLVQGTLGYLDPEYMQTSQLTEKSDVYSFGVVMAELLTGKKALSFDRPEIGRNLAISFVTAIKENRLLQILENHIVNEDKIEQLKEFADLAKRCLRLRGEDRPSVKEVATELERLRSMGKRPLGNIDVCAKNIECLLSASSHPFNIDVGTGCSTSTTAEYDSIKDQVLKPVEDGI